MKGEGMEAEGDSGADEFKGDQEQEWEGVYYRDGAERVKERVYLQGEVKV